jgi:hypothetical protein
VAILSGENINIVIFNRKTPDGGLLRQLGLFSDTFTGLFSRSKRIGAHQAEAPTFRPPSLRQAAEQYLTSGQLAAHFLRQVNGRAQCAQALTGRLWGLRKPPPDLP